jgi:tRNA pseudouridine38-40 synthase
MRLRLDMAYDGTDFSGWATQRGRRTVQGELERALQVILRSGPVAVVGAGRTDSGVHARGQVCHVDVADDTVPTDLIRRLSGVLPADIGVRAVAPAPPDFDARFAALWRRYAYRICDHSQAADPLRRREVLSWPRALDLDMMNLAAARLVGRHDFAAYCRRREGATTIRTLTNLAWARAEGGLAVCRVVADAFCHHMVRSLVGAMVAVGTGQRPVGWPAEVLGRGERDPGVRVLPAHGLTLEEVGYPPDHDLAARVAEARSVRVLA